MSLFEEAIQLDVSEQIEAAAICYEAAIRSEDAPPDAFINLACLYWQSTEYGFNFAKKLDLKFIDLSALRFKQVLEAGRRRLGNLPEIRFWEIYFPYVDWSAPLPIAEVLSLVEKNPDITVPYIHLYGETGDIIYFPKINQLIKEALELPTTKNRYIVSIIGGSLRKHNHEELFRLYQQG